MAEPLPTRHVQKVYCVVPVYNRQALTGQCVEQLNGQDYPSLHIVVVDQACTDGTTEFLDSWTRSHINLTALKGDSRFWWTASVKMGIAHVLERAEANDYLML